MQHKKHLGMQFKLAICNLERDAFFLAFYLGEYGKKR